MTTTLSDICPLAEDILRRYAQRRSARDLDDVVQEMLVILGRCLRRVPNIRLSGKVLGWIYQDAIRNLSWDFVRKSDQRVRLGEKGVLPMRPTRNHRDTPRRIFLEPLTAGTEAHAQRHVPPPSDTALDVNFAVSALPPGLQTVVRLRMDGLTYADIGRRTGTCEATALHRFRQASALLRQTLRAYE